MRGGSARFAPAALAAALVLLAGACGRSMTEPGTEPGGFELAASRAVYAAGGAVVVTVTNRSGRTVEFGACESYAVDRRAGGAWSEVYRSPDSVPCILIAYVLADGESRPVTVGLPTTLAPAEYRVRIARFAPAATNTFQVRSRSAP